MVGGVIRRVQAAVDDERGLFDIYVYISRNRKAEIDHAVEYEAECICDFDEDGRLIGVEVIGIPIIEEEEEEELTVT